MKSLSYNFQNRIRSQKLKNLYYENGAIYIFDCKKFKKIKNRIMKPFGTYLMSEQNSLDLDSKDDLVFWEKVLDENWNFFEGSPKIGGGFFSH